MLLGTKSLADGHKSAKTRYISLSMRASVAIAALIWVFWDQDWRELGNVFARLTLGYFLLSLGIFGSAQFLLGWRWWWLLRAQDIHIAFSSVVRLHFLGLFYNNFMPGSVGGDLLRMWYVAKHTEKKLEAAVSVFVDRVVGLGGMLAIAAFCYLAFMRGQDVLTFSRTGGGVRALLATHGETVAWVLGGLAVVLAGLWAVRPGRRLLERLVFVVAVHGHRLAREVSTSVAVYCRSPLTLFWTLSLTILLQTMVIGSFWVLGMDLRVDAPARYYFVFFPLVWVVGAIPVSIAGIGILEGGLVVLFTRFAGVEAKEVLALALCQRFIWMLASLPGVAVHLFGTHLPKDFFIDAPNPLD